MNTSTSVLQPPSSVPCGKLAQLSLMDRLVHISGLLQKPATQTPLGLPGRPWLVIAYQLLFPVTGLSEAMGRWEAMVAGKIDCG